MPNKGIRKLKIHNGSLLSLLIITVGTIYGGIVMSKVNATVKLKCDAKSIDGWYFAKRHENLTLISGTKNKTKIKIKHMQIKYTGYYTCYGLSENGIPYQASMSVVIMGKFTDIPKTIVTLHTLLLYF